MLSKVGVGQVGVHDVDVANPPERRLVQGLRISDKAARLPEDDLAAGIANPMQWMRGFC